MIVAYKMIGSLSFSMHYAVFWIAALSHQFCIWLFHAVYLSCDDVPVFLGVISTSNNNQQLV